MNPAIAIAKSPFTVSYTHLMLRRYELTDEEWNRIVPLLPPENTGKQGRQMCIRDSFSRRRTEDGECDQREHLS